MITRRSRYAAAILVVLGLAGGQPAAALSLEIEFFGSADIGRYRTFAWAPGLPAPNHVVEQTLHDSVEKELQKRGFRELTGGIPDCYVVTKALRDRMFGVGLLWIEIYDGDSKRLVYRGKASEVASNDVKKVQRIVKKAVKKLLQGLPDVRSR